MPDRDDIFGRYWLNMQRGILFAAAQVSVLTSPIPKKSRIYYGLRAILYSQVSYLAFHQRLTSEDGRTVTDAQTIRSHEEIEYSFQSETLAACDKLLHDKAYVEHRFAGDLADPFCGTAMRKAIEGALVAFRLNQDEFWRLKTQAHRRGIRFALGLPLYAFAGGMLACAGQVLLMNWPAVAEVKNLLYGLTCGLPALGLIAGWVRAAMHKGAALAHHKEVTAGIASVSRRNARQIEADLAGQRAYLQGLIDEVTLHAGLCADEVRINGRTLASAVEQKAFLGRVARFLTAVLAGHYEYQRICRYLTMYVAEAAESQALYRAFYFNLGPDVRVGKSLPRMLGLGLMSLAMIAGAAGWWMLMQGIGGFKADDWPALAGPGVALACCLASIGHAAGLMKLFDNWLRERLPPGLITDLTGGGAPDQGGSGPLSGGPSPALSPEGHLENRLFEAERIETLQRLAEEERRRGFPPF